MLILEGADLTQWRRAEPRQDESSNGRHQVHVPCQSPPPTGMSTHRFDNPVGALTGMSTHRTLRPAGWIPGYLGTWMPVMAAYSSKVSSRSSASIRLV